MSLLEKKRFLAKVLLGGCFFACFLCTKKPKSIDINSLKCYYKCAFENTKKTPRKQGEKNIENFLKKY